jgi:hypothetical protein
LFTEFQSGIITGRIGGARPTDSDSIDLHQGFVEIRSPPGQGSRVSLRIGRQELNIGSSRLISASPGLNNKRSFDGVRLAFGRGSWNFESVAAVLTDLRPGAFDDNALEHEQCWGFAATRPSPRWVTGFLGFYYLGLDNRNAQFAQGLGRDLRHTCGVTWRGTGHQFDLNYDVILQTGSFMDSSARAWAMSTDTGYRWSQVTWTPRIGVRFNAISGDRDAADPRLQSFNPLFPGASYAGPMGLFGPTNMTDLTPAVSVVPRKGLVVGFERPLHWRTSTGDGIYNVSQRLLFPPSAGVGRYIGASAGVSVVWQATRHLQVTGVILRLKSGPFLKTTFAGNGASLYSITTTYRF